MKRRTKILIPAAAVLVAAAMITAFSLVKPLLRSSAARVIYSVGEDFKENGLVFRPLFGHDLYYLYLPEVNVLYRWWIIDFEYRAIYSPRTPRSLLSIPYVSRDEPLGASIGDVARMGAWRWTFAGSGVSFAGSDFICSVQRTKGRGAGTGSTTAR